MFKPLLFFSFTIIISSCAGPSDPFGSINHFTKVENQKLNTNERVEISFFPSKQISHRSQELKVSIEDPEGIGRNHEINVQYNDHYLDKQFIKKAKKELSSDGKNLLINFGKIRLLPNRKNEIIVTYKRDDKSGIAAKQYFAPSCALNDYQVVKSFEGFSEHKEVFDKIERFSRRRDINPSLISALIAQESSFNSSAVSWAKAVGLTQVTTVASEQIKKQTREWPRHRAIASMSVPTLKWYISSNKINDKNEWRLNEDLSIKGGIEFLEYLVDYWNMPENHELLKNSFNHNVPWSEIILASYNSGAYNVKKSIKHNGKDWLLSRNLKEARKYVGKINSYCFAFRN